MEDILASTSLYTYQDYLSWPSNERWEIIDGIAYNMAPAPSSNHQRIIRELATTFNIFLRGKTCEIFPRYEMAGVAEYWIIHPEGKTVVVYSLGSDGKYGRPNVYTAEDQLAVNILPGLIIDLTDIFRVLAD